ncbi:thioredoxin fold domain-containing protein [Acidithiobacillus thiooxidans]|uniref:Thioredoxin-like fold domain-containing protein n=1 Tax=Acidithiobacillus thiooxidans TaxID=930 RepID=A0A1C2I774_ACITH|nr:MULTISPECIES: thioredoxin domain-containing protein [Acidithiobacillus]MBU2743588.1 thioredoxin fold domain-containing protein [Acidithiobacillus albertensis]MBU2792421.1 thioredoxin fold domain-containing protein [Acidithiobacillus thiooxidans]MBU2838734.1 thioredoxin fold domain-containing protein [Acidithiobacillus thiooxidans]MBU2843206.1 thioredoxin fold domain-containing protein [Acidithiobacillus thiooxidans]OCX71818.1 hypothetical protein A6O24_14945 [Acidithiobacillus thiooxidans]
MFLEKMAPCRGAAALLIAFLFAPVSAWAEVPVPPIHRVIIPKVPPVSWHTVTGDLTVRPSDIPHAETVPQSARVSPRALQGVSTLQGTTPSLTPLTARQQALLQKVHGFLWGAPSAPEKAIIFFDPNCIWCHRFFGQVQAGVAQGKARYLMIPVAILKKSSVPKAERILSAQNPQAAFLTNEQHFSVVNESGGLSGKPFQASKTIQDILAINTAVLSDLENHAPETPTIIVHTPGGMALHAGFIGTGARSNG